ncbi:MAG TPA: adenine phosphoribosyltransferase, partial [Hyphomicrobiaceae bacterium]|nr:adenine phosphoribosyltransferase [Hyphomicrobiaceae bacterium]
VRLLRKLKAEVVGAAFIIDLPDLGGAARLAKLGVECHALMAFEGD